MPTRTKKTQPIPGSSDPRVTVEPAELKILGGNNTLWCNPEAMAQDYGRSLDELMMFVNPQMHCTMKPTTREKVIQFILPGIDIQQYAGKIQKAQKAYAKWILCSSCRNPMFDVALHIKGQKVYTGTTTQTAEGTAAPTEELTTHSGPTGKMKMSKKHKKKLDREAAKAAKAAAPASKKSKTYLVKSCVACGRRRANSQIGPYVRVPDGESRSTPRMPDEENETKTRGR